MSLGSNPSKHRNTKSDTIITQIDGATGRFLALKFVKTEKVTTNITEITTSNPTVLINGSDIFFDFSHLLQKTSNNNTNINNIKLLFKSTVKENETLTIKNGEFLNELTSSDPETYDLSGTVMFKSFDEDTLTVKAEIISLDNQSESYVLYDYRFFINKMIWTTTSAFNVPTVKNINEIVNLLPSSSQNSFSSTLGNMRNNDVIELLINNKSYTFKVSNFYTDEQGTEHIEVYENVPEDIDILGTEIYVRLKRRRERISKNNKSVRVLETKESYNACIKNTKNILKKCNSECPRGNKNCYKECQCQWTQNRIQCWKDFSSNTIPDNLCADMLRFCSYDEYKGMCGQNNTKTNNTKTNNTRPNNTKTNSAKKY